MVSYQGSKFRLYSNKERCPRCNGKGEVRNGREYQECDLCERGFITWARTESEPREDFRADL